MEKFDNLVVTVSAVAVIVAICTFVRVLCEDAPKTSVEQRLDVLEQKCDSLQRQIDFMVE